MAGRYCFSRECSYWMYLSSEGRSATLSSDMAVESERRPSYETPGGCFISNLKQRNKETKTQKKRKQCFTVFTCEKAEK